MRLVLIAPPPGVDFGLQRGRGANAECVLVRRSDGGDISFDFSMTVAEGGAGGSAALGGPFAQGPAAKRFVYIGVGTYAGQRDTPWSRRIKVPLDGVTATLIRKVLRRPGSKLIARIPGTGRDGGPSCATVSPLEAWEVGR